MLNLHRAGIVRHTATKDRHQYTHVIRLPKIRQDLTKIHVKPNQTNRKAKDESNVPFNKSALLIEA